MLIISPTKLTDESLAPDNSRLTVAAAYRQIAKKYKLSEDQVKSEIVRALLGGHLHVRNQAGFPYCPDVLDLTVECITFDDLNDYFASQGHRYRLYRCDFDAPAPVDAKGGKEHVSVKEIRIEKIVSFLIENGIDLMCVPRGWKGKAEKHLTEGLRLCSHSGFVDAWKEGAGVRFKDVYHDRHAKRY